MYLFNLDQSLAFVSGAVKYFMYLCAGCHMVGAWVLGEQSDPGGFAPGLVAAGGDPAGPGRTSLALGF